MTARQIELTSPTAGERLDRVLADLMPDISRSRWQRLIKHQHVLVDGKPAKGSMRLTGTETIEVDIPEPVESDLAAELIDLDVRYEDRDIIIVNKPAGMVVHPGPGHESGTLVNALLAYVPDLQGIGDTRRPGIIHRLDKETSGLIIAAKNEVALRRLQAQFKARTIKKKYVALVHDHIQPPSALIDAPIGRDPRQRKRMSVIARDSLSNQSMHAREARTRYTATKYYDEYSLVECAPITGRTHQIRVHLAYVGYPIVGDKVYGRRKERLPIKRHFLHAEQLTFARPSDGEVLTITSELPPELQLVLNQLGADS